MLKTILGLVYKQMKECNQLDYFPKLQGALKKNLKLKLASRTCEIDSYLATYVIFPAKAKMNINGFNPCKKSIKNN